MTHTHTLALTESDLDLLLDALLAFERATDEAGRIAANDPDDPDYGDPAYLDRMAARVDHAANLARQVSAALDAARLAPAPAKAVHADVAIDALLGNYPKGSRS